MTSIYEVQKALTSLFYDEATRPNRISAAQRVTNVEAFLERHSDVDALADVYRMPTTRKKELTRYNLSYILGEYILCGDHGGSNHKTHETELVGNYRNAEREIGIYTSDDRDRDKRKGTTQPYGTIDEYELCESELFNEDATPTLDDFKAQLYEIKENAEAEAARLHEKYARDIAETIAAIEEMEPENVRLCDTCGGPFMAHSKRQHTCDTQIGRVIGRDGKPKTHEYLSQCQIDKRKHDKRRKRMAGVA